MPQHRSSKTGRKVSRKHADSNPDTTIREGKTKDAQRLDWLQLTRHGIHPHSEDGNFHVIDDTGFEIASGKTIRAAIDFARSGS